MTYLALTVFKGKPASNGELPRRSTPAGGVDRHVAEAVAGEDLPNGAAGKFRGVVIRAQVA
jgi:hypothetical protein